MNAGRTARERARAELTREIKDEARRQLADAGANGLSLRAVARELGMVSSALYRYFPRRDELLTALIIDAYGAVADVAATAEAGVDRADTRGRWRATWHAVRAWARAHPHEYALIYGSPVPGYQAPQDTVTVAARIPLLLVGVLRDAHAAGTLTAPNQAGPHPPVLERQLKELAAAIAPELPPDVLVSALIAWTQLFGMISFELFGQLVGSVDPSDEFFAAATERMAGLVGLPDKTSRPAR
jgi:AcrR family transcriptional regulator